VDEEGRRGGGHVVPDGCSGHLTWLGITIKELAA
jgi:hypothetical protein